MYFQFGYDCYCLGFYAGNIVLKNSLVLFVFFKVLTRFLTSHLVVIRENIFG